MRRTTASRCLRFLLQEYLGEHLPDSPVKDYLIGVLQSEFAETSLTEPAPEHPAIAAQNDTPAPPQLTLRIPELRSPEARRIMASVQQSSLQASASRQTQTIEERQEKDRAYKREYQRKRREKQKAALATAHAPAAAPVDGAGHPGV